MYTRVVPTLYQCAHAQGARHPLHLFCPYHLFDEKKGFLMIKRRIRTKKGYCLGGSMPSFLYSESQPLKLFKKRGDILGIEVKDEIFFSRLGGLKGTKVLHLDVSFCQGLKYFPHRRWFASSMDNDPFACLTNA